MKFSINVNQQLKLKWAGFFELLQGGVTQQKTPRTRKQVDENFEGYSV